MNKNILVQKRNGDKRTFDARKIQNCVRRACKGIENVDPKIVVLNAGVKLYDGIKTSEIDDALIKSARALIEQDPNYKYVASRLLLPKIYKEVFNGSVDSDVFTNQYKTFFKTNLNKLIKEGLIHPDLATFNFRKILPYIDPSRDLLFGYEGLDAIADRYLFRLDGKIVETPQAHLMRVAMGLALKEKEDEREKWAVKYYNIMSQFDYVPSTPTLFYSGSVRNQLSSCFLSTFEDSIEGIFDGLHQEAQKSKFAGGLGMDITNFRAANSDISTTGGVVPGSVYFWKLFNDMLVAVNQCFVHDTKIITDKGIQEISKIDIGDRVITHKGNWKRVIDTLHHKQLTNKTYDIKVRHSYEPITCTENHPFFILDDHRANELGAGTKEMTNLITHHKVDRKWVKAKNLKVGHYVGFEKPKTIPLISSQKKWNKEQAKLYGLFLGSGWVTKSKREMGICFNSEANQDDIDFVRTFLEKNNIHYRANDGRESKHLSDKYYSMVWSYKSHKDKFSFKYDDLYNDDRKKVISNDLLYGIPTSKVHYVIEGLVRSDGRVHFNKEITFGNTSIELIDCIKIILMRVGVLCSGSYIEGTESMDANLPGNINLDSNPYVVLRIPAYKKLAKLLDIKSVSKKHYFEYGGCLFTRIKSIKVREHNNKIDMFDLTVEDESSFTTLNGGIVHNSGKRRGSGALYLETWHYDIEDFLAFKRNTGDDRIRGHDINTANWIPDLFMKQVINEGKWYLFSPNEVSDLHDLHGPSFEKRYWEYVKLGQRGKLKLFREVEAKELWKQMLRMLFETGHPWMTFKDPSNARYSNQHEHVVHSSNLCTEIILGTKPTTYEPNNKRKIKEYGETAVCNLGSINLLNHISSDGSIDLEKLQNTIEIAIRMLDNVIDINFYPTEESKKSNTKHRPIGLGSMGWHDFFFAHDVVYDSEEAVKLSNDMYEFISYFSILASSKLAKERGKYDTYDGSLWDQNIFPIDTYCDFMNKERGGNLNANDFETLDWNAVREHVKKYGMRNSNTMAIAPNATISRIAGCSPCTEPYYNNIFARSSQDGDFIVVNEWFVQELKKLDLWNHDIINQLKVVDGDVTKLELPVDKQTKKQLEDKFKTAFQVDQNNILESAAARGRWIDQGMSVNLFNNQTSLKYLHEMYIKAWELGLKTTYYLRSKGASQVEKSSAKSATLSQGVGEMSSLENIQACNINEPECESCQ